jgi:hypothetical protein
MQFRLRGAVVLEQRRLKIFPTNDFGEILVMLLSVRKWSVEVPFGSVVVPFESVEVPFESVVVPLRSVAEAKMSESGQSCTKLDPAAHRYR